jgi:predicted CopG family antitoxin
MSTSIRISEDTKAKLDALKRDDETFDQLLDRLARTEKDVEEMGGWADDDVVEGAAETREKLNESLEKRNRQA